MEKPPSVLTEPRIRIRSNMSRIPSKVVDQTIITVRILSRVTSSADTELIDGECGATPSRVTTYITDTLRVVLTLPRQWTSPLRSVPKDGTAT